MNKTDIIYGYKFPACQKYWVMKEKNVRSDNVVIAYATFYFRGKSLQKAEDYLLKWVKEKARRKLRAAQKVVMGLTDFLEDERVLTKEQLLKKYKI